MEQPIGIEFDDKTVGVWFLATTEKQDWLASVREIEPDAKYELTYRFHYYKDEAVFESEDEKHWYRGTCSATRAYVIESIRSLQKIMASAATYPKTSYELLNDGDMEKFFRTFQNAPFAYVRMETTKPQCP